MKKVSVVIPTWNRPDMTADTIKNISEQDYENIEILVIVEGHDIRYSDAIFKRDVLDEWRHDIQVYQLGQNISSKRPQSFGIAPLLTGYFLAEGDYIMPWCDDERALVPDHISKLVRLIEDTQVDYVYPLVKIWRVDDPEGPETAIIGTCPPQENQITHYLFRASNLWKYGLPAFDTHPFDWALINHWRPQTACAMLEEVTFSHRLDQ